MKISSPVFLVKLRAQINTINPGMLIAVGIGITTMGLRHFSDRLEKVDTQIKETMSILETAKEALSVAAWLQDASATEESMPAC